MCIRDRIIEDPIEEIEKAIAEAKEQSGEHFTVKQMEKTRKTLEDVYKRQAINAGKTALHTVNEVLETLDNAEGWSTWDVMGGGLGVDLSLIHI